MKYSYDTLFLIYEGQSSKNVYLCGKKIHTSTRWYGTRHRFVKQTHFVTRGGIAPENGRTCRNSLYKQILGNFRGEYKTDGIKRHC